MANLHQVELGKNVKMSALTANGKDLHDDRDKAEKEFKKLREEFADLQPKLYAEGKQKLLIVFQAMDAGGKDGTIRSITKGVNPQGVNVVSFKAPSKRELAHDFLWRVHHEVPGAGHITIFNRSHYEDVLVVRVENLAPQQVWEQRYDQINQFEKYLTDTGTRIVKFYLHIDKDEQRQRFQERLDAPEKHWKFSKLDLEKRKHWDQYMDAFDAVLERCNTKHAPWYVIPANQNWYRDLAVSRVIVQTLREMDCQYPEPEAGLENVVIVD